MRTNRILSGSLMGIAGFLLWAVLALAPQAHRIVEAWDSEFYWQVGIPALLILQAGVGAWVRDRLWREPLCAVAGHFLAAMLIRPPGSDLGLLPLSIALIGAPLFGALLLAATLGRWARNTFAVG